MVEKIGDVGKVAPIYKGEWNVTTQYKKLDLVIISSTGSTYIAKQDNVGVPPEDNSSTWGIVALASNYTTGGNGMTPEEVEGIVNNILQNNDNVIKGSIDSAKVADKWAKPIKVNGVDVDGTSDVTITAVPSNNGNLVHQTGDESIDGNKKFEKPIEGSLHTKNVTSGTDMYRYAPEGSGDYFVDEETAKTLVNPPFGSEGFFLNVVVSSSEGVGRYINLTAINYLSAFKVTAVNFGGTSSEQVENKVKWSSELGDVAGGENTPLNAIFYHDKDHTTPANVATAKKAVDFQQGNYLALQHFARDEMSGDWFATAVLKNQPGAEQESVYISHMDSQGRFQDAMLILNGGHGSTIEISPSTEPGKPFMTVGTGNASYPYMLIQYMPGKSVDIKTEGKPINMPRMNRTKPSWNRVSNNGLMVQMDEGSASGISTITRVNYNASTGEFTHLTEPLKFDPQPIVNKYKGEIDLVNQGDAILEKSQITGNKNDTNPIFFFYSGARDDVAIHKGSLIVAIEVDEKTGELTELTPLKHVEEVVRPLVNNSTWLLEAEGIAIIRYDSPSATSDAVYGLAFGHAIGYPGSQFSQVNVFASSILHAGLALDYHASSINSQVIGLPKTKKLTDWSKDGRFKIAPQDFAEAVDTPWEFRSPDHSVDVVVVLENSKASYGSRYTQRLELQTAGERIVYERQVLHATYPLSTGAEQEPTVGTWFLVSQTSSGQKSLIKPWQTATTDFTIPSRTYFVGTSWLNTGDPELATEKLNGWIKTGDIQTTGNGSVLMLQTFIPMVAPTATNPKSGFYTRWVGVEKDPYGGGAKYAGTKGNWYRSDGSKVGA